MCAAETAGAWVYPEHRDIAVLAVGSLDPERRAVFDRLWADARAGHEQRLCEHGADVPGAPPDRINWASMSMRKCSTRSSRSARSPKPGYASAKWSGRITASAVCRR
jgi:hypothetical protein